MIVSDDSEKVMMVRVMMVMIVRGDDSETVMMVRQ